MKRASVATLVISFLGAPLAFGADGPAEALARKSGCFKCHAIDKEKVSPSYREIAAKYKGDETAEQKLYVHLTTQPIVKVDGEDETHTTLKSDKEADIRQVVRWILSQ
jgi:cytochrome c